jgi:probable F420-dependent oxidoreductase
MKYSLCLPVDQVVPPSEFCSGAAITEMAKLAEDMGFDALHPTEHPFPSNIGTKMGGHSAFDPVVCCAFMAAVTRRLKLHVNLFVPAYRNPFLLAKNIADLDYISGGRLIAGMGAGYMPGEFAALGADIEKRNELFDEALVAMKAAWTGEPVFMDSPRFKAEGNVMLPRPFQQPHPAVWIGGNSKAAIRRVVKHAQGWMPFPTRPKEAEVVRTAAILNRADMHERIKILRAEAAAAGRTAPIDICMTPFSNPHTPRGQETYDPPALFDEAAEFSQVGVTWFAVKVQSPDRKTYLKNMERFGKEVIKK